MSKIRVSLALAEKDIRSMRSVKEVLTMLQGLRTRIAKIVKPIDNLHQALGANTSASTVRAAGSGFQITGPKAKNISLKTEVRGPTRNELEQIAESWARIQELKDIKSFCDRTISTIDIKFRANKYLNRMQKEAKAARTDAVAGLQKAQEVMDSLGAKHIPRSINAFVDKLDRELQENLHFKRARRRIYVVPSPKSKIPTFYAYLTFTNVQTEDSGTVEPEYNIVLTAQPQDHGFAFFINTIRRFELPHRFGPGKRLNVDELDSIARRKAIGIIQQQLDLDHIFMDFRSAFPQMDVPKIDGVKRAEVVDDFLYVYGNKKLKPDDVPRITSNILALLDAGGDISQYQELVPKVSQTPEGPVIRYSLHSLGRAGKENQMTVDQMNTIGDMLGLTPSQMRAFRQALKND